MDRSGLHALSDTQSPLHFSDSRKDLSLKAALQCCVFLAGHTTMLRDCAKDSLPLVIAFAHKEIAALYDHDGYYFGASDIRCICA